MRALPLVSVVIPCFNHGRFLGDAVASALAQTYPELEVIVVNDGSTDDSSAVAKTFLPRIELVEQENAGLSAARNAGVRAARGDFVVLLDADDVLLPHCVASRMRYLLEDDGVGLVAGYYREIDEHGRLLPRIPELRRLPEAPHFAAAVRRNWGPPLAWTIRTRAFELCGMFDPFLRSCEDWDFLIRLSARFKIAYDPEVGAYYRQIPSSMSRSHLVMYDAGQMVMRKNAAYAPSKLAYAWWSRLGRFQHGRRILYNILTTGPVRSRIRSLVSIVVRRPAMLWIGFFSLLSFAAGKRASSEPAQPLDASSPSP